MAAIQPVSLIQSALCNRIFYIPLTIAPSTRRYHFRMSSEPLQIVELKGSAEGTCIFQLSGPLILANLFGFQAKVREDSSAVLILDFTSVPLIDSAGIGALVGAYVNRQKDGRRLGLAGVNKRVHDALEITRVESLFKFYNSIPEVEQARD